MNESLLHHKAELLGSFLYFTQVFYKLRTGRDFILSRPIARESHHLTIAKAFNKVLALEILRLLINVEPGSSKSELCKHFIAWGWAHYPDSNFIYLSYSHELASKHTYGIKQIVTLPYYRKLFGVEIARDSAAKDNFRTTAGGIVYAAGSTGTVTGQDAGLPHLDRFSGALVMDDMHKPDEVHSDTMRQAVIDNYFSTIIHRARGQNVPIICMGQRLHEDDLSAHLIAGKDGYEWHKIILKSIDDAGNVLYPEVHPRDFLLKMQETAPYEFASQYQQDPQPAGGGIFKKEWFVLLDEEPTMLATFVVCDSAETDKTYNDATVFSFFGIYKIKIGATDTGLLGLHWIDCYELWVEPKDLKNEFLQFWIHCLRHPVKPKIAAIEKKSTGVTLLSVLEETQGLELIKIERGRDAGNKTTRFLAAQPYVASKQVSLPSNGKHTPHCLEHMRKITANETHRLDDIADTLSDGIQLALIDNAIYNETKQSAQANQFIQTLAKRHNQLQQLRVNQWR